MNKFKELGLSQELFKTIETLGFEEPTQIQRKSIPFILQGKDVIGESATGSGKTLAFGCGIIEKVIPDNGLQALVLTPTRELANQVKESLVQFSGNKKLSIISVYGGVSINTQIQNLPKADVVVATPGRLLDHINRKTINMSKISFLVIDEADRMFDMGFIRDIKKIMNICPSERQTLFFSATLAHKIKELADRYTKNPIVVFAEKMVDPEKLSQMYYDVLKNEKLSVLVHLLQNKKSNLVMVFCNTRRTTNAVAKNLRANKIDAIEIHGGLSQYERTKNIESFSSNKANVLVCTDVAARGLHISNVSHIYNYELPGDPNDYVHRIGRTARAGEEGSVINLLSNEDHRNFRMIIDKYRTFDIEKETVSHYKKITPMLINSYRGPRSYSGRNNPRGSYSNNQNSCGNYRGYSDQNTRSNYGGHSEARSRTHGSNGMLLPNRRRF
ncbi:MAG: DEAD/DEAH box helicase [Nanoarchaeota archaeon]|nr:DEAD/DEAH box helicase [Nanoarchaeota archaeon]MBU2519637.1 DEAD/DEAH box helicase [Nanoarchaeota archaeon]